MVSLFFYLHLLFGCTYIQYRVSDIFIKIYNTKHPEDSFYLNEFLIKIKDDLIEGEKSKCMCIRLFNGFIKINNQFEKIVTVLSTYLTKINPQVIESIQHSVAKPYCTHHNIYTLG